MNDRVKCISRKHPLSLRRQCQLLQVARSRVYYTPGQEKPENLEMMRLMDPHLLEHPTEGVKSMVPWLRERGYHVGPKRVRRLLRLMGHQAIYPKRNLSKLGKAVYVRPYLLRKLDITRANQAWCTDITYVPMSKGFMYLTAVMDIYSRKILSWGVSNTMEADWCKSVMAQAVAKYGVPEIVNSDQGSQYTSDVWTAYIEDELKTKISMDGKGRAIDNRWIERFWRTIKWNRLYIYPSETGSELRHQVKTYITYYNQRNHQTFDQNPAVLYRESMSLEMAS